MGTLTNQSAPNPTVKRLQWSAASFVFVAVCFHAFDVYPLGPMFHLAGAVLWFYAGIRTKQGPILLNFGPQIGIWSSGLIWHFFF